MPATWSEVPVEVTNLVERMIARNHADLRDARIGVVFRSEPSKSQGKDVWAKAEKVSPKWNAVLENTTGEQLHFLIWIAEDVWQMLDAARREALIDHELEHCYMLAGDPKMRGHDFEDFACIVERHGFWNHGLMGAEKAFSQAALFELERQGKVVTMAMDRMIEEMDEDESDE